MLDDWLEVIDAIFDVRLSPLLLVLQQYESMAQKEKDGKAFIVDKQETALSVFIDDDGNMRSEMVRIDGLDEVLDNLEQKKPVGGQSDDDDEEDFLDEPELKVEPKKMKDMEMIDPLEGDEIFDMRGSVQAETGSQTSEEKDNAFLKILASQGITDTEQQLNFVDNLSQDYIAYRKQQSPHAKPSNESLFKYLREQLGYIEDDMVLMEALRKGLDISPSVNLIDDLEFSHNFQQIVNKMLDAI